MEKEFTDREKAILDQMARHMAGVAVGALMLIDKDADGFLSEEEGAALISVPSNLQAAMRAPGSGAAKSPEPNDDEKDTVRPMPNFTEDAPSTVSENLVVLNREMLTRSLSEKYTLTPQVIDALISQALPKGMQDVSLATLCNLNPQLQCFLAPNGKIIHLQKTEKSL